MITLYGMVGLLFGLLSSSATVYFFRQRKSLIYYRWGVFSISAAIWGWCSFGVGVTTSPAAAEFFWRLAVAGLAFISIAFIHVVFTYHNEKRIFLMTALYAIGISLAAASFIDGWIVTGVRWTFGRIYYVEAGSLFWAVTAVYFGLAAYGLGKIWISFRTTKGVFRIHMLYNFIGSGIGFGGGFFYFLPAFGIDWFYPVLPNLAIIGGTIAFTYTALKLRIKGWQSFLRSIIFYSLIATVLVLIWLLFTTLATELWGGVWHLYSLLVLITVSLIVAWLTPRFLEWLGDYLHKGIYGSDYNVKLVLTALAKAMPGVLNFEALIKLLNRMIIGQMGIEWLRVELPSAGQSAIPAVWHKLERKGETIITDELFVRLHSQGELKDRIELLKVYEELEKNKIAAVIPLFSHQNLAGIVLLGNKINSQPYTEDDIGNFQIITANAGIALENARLYRESEQFGEKLEREVKRATKELEEANRELKMLDKAKNEFIRLASHQLYTPLTSARGYVSMMLEGDYGAIPQKPKEVLEIINRSTVRLVSLVKNLLDITKIEAGHFRLSLEEVKMEGIVREVIEEMKPQAEEKGLGLEAEIEDNLVMLIGDKRRLRQAALNLIDNGIKYTAGGKITVRLFQEEEDIYLQVADTGRGLLPEEMEKLFRKFSRLPDAPLVHTEGVGLGLFIVQQIAIEHNGMVKVESAGHGKGSIFTLTLPSAASEKSLKIGDEVAVVG